MDQTFYVDCTIDVKVSVANARDVQTHFDDKVNKNSRMHRCPRNANRLFGDNGILITNTAMSCQMYGNLMPI